MKIPALFLVLCLGTIGLWAQAAPQTPAPPPPPAPHAGGDHAMAMHHHMQMETQVTKMRMTLEKMKTNLGKISDPQLKQHAQLDVELWESMVQHMEDMVKMMSMQGGMMGGHDHPNPDKNEMPKADTK